MFQSGSGGSSSYKPGLVTFKFLRIQLTMNILTIYFDRDEVVVTHRGKEIGKAIFIEKQDGMFCTYCILCFW